MRIAIDATFRLLEYAIAVLLALMVAMVFGNVVLRYGFNSGIVVSEELSRWCFVWLTFLGAVIALRERAHLGSDFVVSRLPVAGRRACLVLGRLIMLGATWLIFSGALAQTRINLNVDAAVTGASMAFVYSTGIVFAVMTSLLLLRDLWQAVTGQLDESELITVSDSEELEELHLLEKDWADYRGPRSRGAGREGGMQ